ncbi:hypothetical protein ACA910_005671 [Epithemia clementina (nom. ined.)]
MSASSSSSFTHSVGASRNAASSSDATLMIAAAAAASFAAGAAFSYFYLSKKQKKKTPLQQHHEIPPALRSCPWAPHLELAVSLALQAGANMLPYMHAKGTTAAEHEEEEGDSLVLQPQLLQFECKGQPEDFCTQIDVDNERLIMQGIQQRFPQHCIIGEETTGTGPIPPLSKTQPTWIIDPIDGTTNFAAGLPLTCVSIGLCCCNAQDGEGGEGQQEPVLGVVYVPVLDELYLAVQGCGAYRNGVRLASQSSSTNSVTTTLSNAVVGFEFGYVRRQPEAAAAMTKACERILVHGCRAMRQLGSGVLDLVYVACGKLHVVYAGLAGEGWKPWDLCAGAVILQETGCVLETLDDDDEDDEPTTTTTSKKKKKKPFDLYTKHHICATNQSLLNEVRAIVQQDRLT